MPNLFPDSDYAENNTTNTVNNDTEYKGSYKFDFDKNEFIKNPDGTIKKCDDLEEYKQWCQLAMATPIGLLGYSGLFGHELNTLTGTEYSKEAIELEVKRMTIDTLMVNPRTKDVTNFNFNWQNNGELYYKYTVTTVDGAVFDLNKSTEIR